MSGDEKLTYEEMLSALQGLLGRQVVAVAEYRYDGIPRPLAVIKGTLRMGAAVDLSSDPIGARLGYPRGEAISFEVGTDDSYFFLYKDAFKHGARDGETLRWESGRSRFVIGPM